MSDRTKKTVVVEDKPVLTDEYIKHLEQKTELKKDQIISFHKNFFQSCQEGKMTKEMFKDILYKFQPAIKEAKRGHEYCMYLYE